MSAERHPSGHVGVDELHDAAGNVVGYLVDGHEFSNLDDALAWRDGPDLPPPTPKPKRGPCR